MHTYVCVLLSNLSKTSQIYLTNTIQMVRVTFQIWGQV